MRTLANIYLLAYLLDGAVSVTDELLRHGFGMAGLGPARTYIALSVLFASFLMLLLLGIDARLPKRLFLPLGLFLVWFSFFPGPIRALAGDNAYIPVLAALQLLMGVGAALYIRRRSGAGILLTREMVSGPVFNWKRSAGYFSVGALLLAGVLTFGTLRILQETVHGLSAGFMRLDSSGLYMAEKEYVRQGTSIHLIAMIHIGDAAYYRNIFRTMNGGDTLVLVEGVTDSGHLLTSFPSYHKLADYLGLVSQNYLPEQILDSLKQQGRAGGEAAAAADYPGPVLPRFIRADIDSGEFSAETIAYLNHVGKVLRDNDTLLHSLIDQYRWSLQNLAPDAERMVMQDLIEKRNAALLGYLRDNLDKYRRIIIPWGALHMPGIERAVIAQGFSLRASSERLAVDFSRMKWRQLLSGDG